MAKRKKLLKIFPFGTTKFCSAEYPVISGIPPMCFLVPSRRLTGFLTRKNQPEESRTIRSDDLELCLEKTANRKSDFIETTLKNQVSSLLDYGKNDSFL